MSDDHASVETDAALVVARQEGAQVMALFEKALSGGVSADALEKLVMLKMKMDDRNAALDFANALSEFQQRCPPIPRTSTAQIATRSGGGYQYRYADFEQIAETTKPHLVALGLSYTFDSSVAGGNLTCTCTLRHVNGHMVSSSFTLPTSSSSAMSDQQRFGAALTFAKRQTLISVLGLALTDPEAPGEGSDPTLVDEDQAAKLKALAEEVKADAAKFLAYLGVESFGAIPAARYGEAVAALEQKRRAVR